MFCPKITQTAQCPPERCQGIHWLGLRLWVGQGSGCTHSKPPPQEHQHAHCQGLQHVLDKKSSRQTVGCFVWVWSRLPTLHAAGHSVSSLELESAGAYILHELWKKLFEKLPHSSTREVLENLFKKKSHIFIYLLFIIQPVVSELSPFDQVQGRSIYNFSLAALGSHKGS